MLQSIQLTWSVYSTSWIGKSQKMKSNIFMMIQRSQKPLSIYMNGLLPSLTLEYYANVRISSFKIYYYVLLLYFCYNI